MTIRIKKRLGLTRWYVEDELGEHSVHVQLKGNGWSIISDPDYPPDLKVENFGTNYIVRLDEDAKTITTVEKIIPGRTPKHIRYLDLPERSPITQFFYKTGKNSRGVEVTVPITHSLDHQQYGVKI